MDLTGRTFGNGAGRGIGRHGRTSQTIGTIIPCPNAEIAENRPANAKQAAKRKDLSLIQYSFKGFRTRTLCVVSFKGTIGTQLSCNETLLVGLIRVERVVNVFLKPRTELFSKCIRTKN